MPICGCRWVDLKLDHSKRYSWLLALPTGHLHQPYGVRRYNTVQRENCLKEQTIKKRHWMTCHDVVTPSRIIPNIANIFLRRFSRHSCLTPFLESLWNCMLMIFIAITPMLVFQLLRTRSCWKSFTVRLNDSAPRNFHLLLIC